MEKTDDAPGLLMVALQDLLAGERLVAERLPAIATHATDIALSEALDRQVRRSMLQADALGELEGASGGPPNLWMQGILDDAQRDTESMDAGPLLDVALIGAVRKALAAKHVSYETAVALAEKLERRDCAVVLRRCRDEESASDASLARLLLEGAEKAA